MPDYEELQQWLDAETAKADAEAADRAAKAKAFKLPTFEQMKFDFTSVPAKKARADWPGR